MKTDDIFKQLANDFYLENPMLRDKFKKRPIFILCECGYNAEPSKDILRRDTCPDCGSQDFKYEE